MNTKTLSSFIVGALILAAPVLTTAAGTVVVTDTGGCIGGSGGGGAFGICWGTGGAICTTTICGVASTIIYTINVVLVPLLFAVAFIVFLYGVFKKYIWSRGDESAVDEGHKLILWGIVGFVVMISVWGLVNVVSNTFGLSGYGAPPPPSSVPSPVSVPLAN